MYEGMNEEALIDGLKARIAASGLSKNRICKDAGIAYTTLDRILRREVSPKLKTVDLINEVLEKAAE